MTSIGASLETGPKTVADLVDPDAVRGAVEQRLAELVALQAEVPQNLQGAARHALLGQSKRVRPVLLYLIAEPRAAQVDAVIDVGCAVEMVHTASLILDDLPCMDDAQMRRQRPTTHIAFGQSTAILSAIAMLTRAFGIIANLDNVSAATRTRLAALLSDAVGWDGLVAGQEIDINGRAGLHRAEQIENLNWLKTGVLFVAAAEMGAVLRGLDGERVQAVRRFARHLGLAFQTADDLLDRTATVEQAGKDVGVDGDKATLVSLFGAGHAHNAYRHHLGQAEHALAESGVSPEPVRMLMARLFDSRQAVPQ